MKKWKLFSGVALIFVFGVLVGVIGTGLFVKHMHPLFKNDPVARKAFILKRLDRALELTDTQIQHIEPILEKAQIHASKLVQKNSREILTIIESSFLEIDRRFHLTLIEASGNRFMIQTYNNIRDHFAITFRGALAKKGRASEVLREHKLVVAALVQENAEMAREAERNHLTNSKSTALDYYSGYVEE